MKAIFAYTDGSCRPNPGFSGYGVHIVIGQEDDKGKVVADKFKLTDRGYVNKANLKTFPAKKFYNVDNVIELYGYNKKSNTNNRAELEAIIELYKFLPKLKLKYEDINEIVLLADSSYALNIVKKALEGTLKVDSNTSNKDLIEELEAQLKICLFNTKIQKVEGHSNDLGNDRADMLAFMGQNKNSKYPNTFKDNNVLEEDKDFWKLKEPDKDIFFGKSLFYFFNDVDKTYYMFNYKEDSDIGKKLSGVQYVLIKKQIPDPDIKLLVDRIKESFKIEKMPFIIYLAVLRNKKIYKDFIRYGDDFLKVDIIKNYREPFVSLKTITGQEIIRELYPQLLSKKVNENFDILEDVFSHYIKQTNEFKVKDITDLIYTKNKKEKTIIHPEFKNDKFKIKVAIDNKNFIFVYPKYDLPPRNTLKRFEKENPKIVVLYREFPGLIEYYTLADLGETKILTVNFYANKTIKKT